MELIHIVSGKHMLQTYPRIFDEYYIKRDFPDVTALVIKDISELTPEFLEKIY